MSTSGGTGGGSGNATQLQGRALAATAPNDGQAIIWVAANSDWEPVNVTPTGALLIANNLSDVASAATSRTNLGLGTAATHAATDFLLAANNLSDVASATTSRTNLGLGTSATHNVGDFAQTANNLSDLANVVTARTNLGLGTSATHNVGDFAQTANNLSDLASVSSARTNLGLGAAALLTDPITIGHGGTGQTTALAGFDALSPLTTEGDLLYFTGGHNARFPVGANHTVLGFNGTDPVAVNRAYPLVTSLNNGSVASIATTASLISGPISAAIPANTLAVGDVLDMEAACTLINASGNSTMYVDFVIGGVASGFKVTVTMASGAARAIVMRLRVGVVAIGASQTSFDVIGGYYFVGAAGANQIVLASTYFGSTGVASVFGNTQNTTANISYDVIVGSTVNNAAIAGQCLGTSLVKLPV